MKKLNILVIITLLFLPINKLTANKSESFLEETGYNLYKKQVQDYCSKYNKTDLKAEKIININESKYFLDLISKKPEGFKIGKDLEIAKKEYKKNMDSIYDCATFSSYLRSLILIKEDLIKRNPKLNSNLKAKIEQKIEEIKKKMGKIEGNCKTNISSNKGSIKLSVLNQVTYETCKYSYYLEYLKDYNKRISSLTDTKKNKNPISINELNKEFSSKINAINKEQEDIYRLFPIAFQAYNDYENNIGNHLLLELLEEDYKLFRIGLHKTLNPINQVVYKISNAMRK